MQKKTHWSARVSECAVRRDARGEVNVPLQGGAENGEFVYVGRVDPGSISYDHGALTEGELLLEVDTLPVSGLPLYDVQSAFKNSRGAVRLKTVRPGRQRYLLAFPKVTVEELLKVLDWPLYYQPLKMFRLGHYIEQIKVPLV